MFPGMVKIDDLHSAGEVLIGQVPYANGPVGKDDFDGGPLPTSAPGFGIDAVAELFGGFDGSHIGGGSGVADGPSVFIHGDLRKDGAEFAFACAGALPLDSAGPALGFGGY